MYHSWYVSKHNTAAQQRILPVFQQLQPFKSQPLDNRLNYTRYSFILLLFQAYCTELAGTLSVRSKIIVVKVIILVRFPLSVKSQTCFKRTVSNTWIGKKYESIFLLYWVLDCRMYMTLRNILLYLTLHPSIPAVI